MLISSTFFTFACGCRKVETISKEAATSILKETTISGNVEVTTITETSINNIRATSSQTDSFYGDKYYHSTNANNLTSKTWYGYVDNALYAFYYTKNGSNEEAKSSSRIESSLLTSAKKQLNSITNTLFDESGNLLKQYSISGTKKGDIYTIEISGSGEEESVIYTITIEDNKMIKIIKNNNILNDTIKTTYDFKYDISDFSLPSLSEYPLTTNG